MSSQQMYTITTIIIREIMLEIVFPKLHIVFWRTVGFFAGSGLLQYKVREFGQSGWNRLREQLHPSVLCEGLGRVRYLLVEIAQESADEAHLGHEIAWQCLRSVTMAEWLRHWSRNPMGFSLTGSYPVRDAMLASKRVIYFYISMSVIAWLIYVKM